MMFPKTYPFSVFSRKCDENNKIDSTRVADALTDVVVEKLGLWIVVHGGWVSKRSGSCMKELLQDITLFSPQDSFERQFPKLFSFSASGLSKGFVLLFLFFSSVGIFYATAMFTSDTPLPPF